VAGIANRIFVDPCLTTQMTPSGYLNDVCDSVDCRDLYMLSRSCYYDNSYAYCPV